MPAVILDACGILNLYASGQFESILTSIPNEWYVPLAVERESQHYRQPDPTDHEKLIKVPIDLLPTINGGLLSRCNCEGDEETDLYIQLAARIGDDGESMGLAIAKCRGWSVLTDDKKARRIAQELGVVVINTTTIIRQWAESTQLGVADLAVALAAINRYANYKPGRGTENFDWWVRSISLPDAE